MSELNYDFIDFTENNPKTRNKPINLKKDISSKQTPNNKYNSKNTLLIVEELSKKKNPILRKKSGIKHEELKLANNNRSFVADYDKVLAFNLANNIVKRRFKYFGKKTQEDSEDSFEFKNRKIRLMKQNKEIKRLEEEMKRKEKERLEREKIEKERMEMIEKEKKEKLKKKEMMKTVEINIEERNRQNHNYKIIKKLTTEVEVNEFKNKNNLNKSREEPIKENYLLKNFKTNNKIDDVSKVNKTLNIKNRRPEINTKHIIITKQDNKRNKISSINQVKIEVNKKTIIKETTEIPSLINHNRNMKQINQIIKHEISPEKGIRTENKKVIIVNKTGENKLNNEINKIFVQKRVVQKDIAIKNYENYNTEGNVRNRYKNQKINNKILADL